MNYTYILKCADGTLYTGWTNDIEKRLLAHNSGNGAKYTKARRPVSLFYLEEHRDRKTAMRREALIKLMTRGEKMKLAETKKRILLVNACVRSGVRDGEKVEESRTMELARHLLGKLDGIVEEIDIEKEKIKPLTYKEMSKRMAATDAGKLDLPMMKYAWQFSEADEIVIAAPYWDLSFPAILKAYFEQITVSGITFKNEGDGTYTKLCKAKKLYYVTTAGGQIFTPNHGYEYVRDLVGTFYGIDDTEFFSAEMLDVDGMDIEKIMAEAKKKIDERF